MKTNLILILFVGAAILFRFIPHPPNFAPITALALFSGVYFSNKILSILLPLLAMLISDMYLGFYPISIWVYISFVLVTIFGILYRRVKISSIFISSLIFFIVSNLGVWVLGYPKTLDGFILCYTLAIPFFGYSLLGDLFFSLVLKHSFNFVKVKWLTTVY
jgi:hypothetical protein